MAEEKCRFLRGLEAVKIIVQIVAIIVAGFWTYMKFIRTEAPLFEITAHVNRSLSPSEMGVDDCRRTFNIDLINGGKTTFVVEKVITRGWKFYSKRDEDAFLELIDLDKIEKNGEIVLEKVFPDPAYGSEARQYPFLNKYRPGENYSHSFEILLKDENDAWIFLKTEIFIKGEENPKVGSVWDRACGFGLTRQIQPTPKNGAADLQRST